MTLHDVLNSLRSYSEDAVICVEAEGKLSLETEATVVDISDENPDPNVPEGMRVLLDVWHAKDILDGLKHLISQQISVEPDISELHERFIIYLRNDA